jgi:acetoin utilization protein AcuB
METVPTIERVMTPFPHTIGLDQSINVAEKMFKQYDVRHLPVRDAGTLVGIVSERDLMYATGWPGDRKEIKIKDIYTPSPYTVEAGTPVDTVAREMQLKRYGCAMVCDQGKLIGIFTTVDACKLLAELLSELPRPDGSMDSLCKVEL